MTYTKTRGNVRPQLKQLMLTTSFLLGLSTVPLPAHALQCGETVGPNETVVLDSDIGPCTEQNDGGITVIGPATLDMNGFTLECIDFGNPHELPDGITIEGKGAKVRNGSIENCRYGVVVAGEGKHRLEELTSRGSLYHGFHILSGQNTLTANTAQESGHEGFNVWGGRNTFTANIAQLNGDDGFHVSWVQTKQTRNKLTRNIARDNGFSGFYTSSDQNTFRLNEALRNDRDGFHISSGEKNKLIQNTASRNEGDGFDIDGDANSLTRNAATNNDGDGFYTSYDKVRFVRNTALNNLRDGFEISGDRVKLLANRAEQNGEVGILLYDGSEHGLITRNVALDNNATDNGYTDLADDETDCGTNRWRRNEFGTANRDCID